MRMAALGHAFARLWARSARVVLDKSDLFEVIGEDARGEETSSAAACYNRVA